MLRTYAELSEREVKALVTEAQCTTPGALARTLAARMEEAQS